MKFDYWNPDTMSMGQRDATPAEVAEVAARVAAAAVPVVPEFVPRLNARLTLLGRAFPDGTNYWTDITSFVTAIAGAAGDQARAYFEDAQTWRRDNSLVASWATSRNLTSAEVDALFITAGALDV